MEKMYHLQMSVPLLRDISFLKMHYKILYFTEFFFKGWVIFIGN